jgi:hypothetical protein
MTSKGLFALAVLTICGSTTGCGSGSGSSTVSEQAARTAYEKSAPWSLLVLSGGLDRQKGDMKLISFRKINDRRGESFGRRYYEVEYEAEWEHLADDRTGAIVAGKMLEGRWKKGDVQKDRGWLRFEETEEGWLGPDGNVY